MMKGGNGKKKTRCWGLAKLPECEEGGGVN